MQLTQGMATFRERCETGVGMVVQMMLTGMLLDCLDTVHLRNVGETPFLPLASQASIGWRSGARMAWQKGLEAQARQDQRTREPAPGASRRHRGRGQATTPGAETSGELRALPTLFSMVCLM